MSNGSETGEEVELTFCDLCGLSIPQRELDAGLAREIDGKRIGSCCLAKLVPAAARESGTRAPLGVLLLGLIVAVGAATLYLDWRASQRDPSSRLDALAGRLAALETRIGEVTGGWKDALAALRAEFDERWASAERERRTRTAELRAETRGAVEALDELRGAFERVPARLASLDERLAALGTEIARLRAEISERLAAIETPRPERPAAPPVRAPGGAGRVAAPEPAISALPERLRARVRDLESDDPGVRWSAVDELIRSKNPAVSRFLVQALEDRDPFVRRLAADGLAKLEARDAIPDLIDRLDDEEVLVREAAWTALVSLSGQRLPFDPEAPAAQRRRMIGRWRDWWKKQSAKRRAR